MARPLPHRVVLLLSLRILWDAQACASECQVDTDAVRLALRCLMSFCAERWPLVTFWDADRQEQTIGRLLGTSAAYKAVLVQLGAGGYRPPPYGTFEAPVLSGR